MIISFFFCSLFSFSLPGRRRYARTSDKTQKIKEKITKRIAAVARIFLSSSSSTAIATMIILHYKIILTVKTRFLSVFVRVKSWVLFSVEPIQQECDLDVRARAYCLLLVRVRVCMCVCVNTARTTCFSLLPCMPDAAVSSLRFRFRSLCEQHTSYDYTQRSPSGPIGYALKWACQYTK